MASTSLDAADNGWKSVHEDEDYHQLSQLEAQIQENHQSKKELLQHVEKLLDESNLLRARYAVEGIRVNSTLSVVMRYLGKCLKILFLFITSLVFAIQHDTSTSPHATQFLSVLMFLHILSVLELSYWLPLILPLDTYRLTQWFLAFWMLAIDSIGLASIVMNSQHPFPTTPKDAYVVILSYCYVFYLTVAAKYQMMVMNYLRLLTPLAYITQRIMKFLEFLYPDYYQWKVMSWEFYWDYQVALLEMENTGTTANHSFLYSSINDIFL